MFPHQPSAQNVDSLGVSREYILAVGKPHWGFWLRTCNQSYISFPLGESKVGEEIHGAIKRGHKGLQAVKSSVAMMPPDINSLKTKLIPWENCYVKPVCPLVYVALIRLLSWVRSRWGFWQDFFNTLWLLVFFLNEEWQQYHWGHQFAPLNRPRYISEGGQAFRFTSHFITTVTTKVCFKHVLRFISPH